ncbi:MAG: glycerol-3-phosphate acyltransferase [Phototrophicaceae bacterium]|jgi:glycerol-3-phosphate acyltransferase PlsY
MFFRACIVILEAYLLGAIPVAYLVARMKSVNIFEVGSGNMGTTNVIRAVGPVLGILVLLLDALKGIVAILIARHYLMPTMPDTATTIAALAAIVGHSWSVFAWMVTGKLKGGKGAATAGGTALMVVQWYVILIMAVVGLLVLYRTRYMSLAVLVMLGIGAPIVAILSLIPGTGFGAAHMVYVTVLTSTLLWRFRENIQRLRAGNERRMGEHTS